MDNRHARPDDYKANSDEYQEAAASGGLGFLGCCHIYGRRWQKLRMATAPG